MESLNPRDRVDDLASVQGGVYPSQSQEPGKRTREPGTARKYPDILRGVKLDFGLFFRRFLKFRVGFSGNNQTEFKMVTLSPGQPLPGYLFLRVKAATRPLQRACFLRKLDAA